MKQNQNFIRIKSELNPTAQTPSLCDVNKQVPSRLMQYINVILSDRYLSTEIKAYSCLLIENGLRISELLNIQLNQTTRNGLICVKGAKGSNDRFIKSTYFNDFFISSRTLNRKIGLIYSRFYFYRQFKRLGIVSVNSNSGNNFVTHSPREVFIKELNIDLNSIEKTKTIVGHKNIKSTEIYINKKTK